MVRIAKFTFNPFQENTYVLHAGGQGIIIDPGCWNASEEHELDSWMTENGVEPVRLVLTHGHIDHVFGCAWLERRYGLRPELHRADLPMLKNAPQVGLMYGTPCDPVPEPAGFLDEGDPILLGDTRLEVLFVPGHAPGHLAFHCPEQQFVINGDVLFLHSIGRTDLPGGDMDMLLHSIRTKLFTLPDGTRVYCGHGPETTIGHEKRGNPFLK